MTLGLFPSGSNDLRRFTRRVDEIAAAGANWIAVPVFWSQPTVRSSSVSPGESTAGDDLVRAVVHRARARGLRVLLFPIVELEERRPGEWRGTLSPRDVNRWWLSYEKFVLHYARLGADAGAEALSIGSELGSTEAWRARWYHLISRVERVFQGEIVYSANWDHYRQVSFWRRLDALGVTGYFPLTRDRDAEARELVHTWRLRASALAAFARERGKPLWLTEVGYPSRDGAAVHPWDYTREAEVDLEEQRRCYQALVAAWDGAPELAGIFFWNWYGDGGPEDRGYTPRGKPAEAVLRAWFSARSTRPRTRGSR